MLICWHIQNIVVVYMHILYLLGCGKLFLHFGSCGVSEAGIGPHIHTLAGIGEVAMTDLVDNAKKVLSEAQAALQEAQDEQSFDAALARVQEAVVQVERAVVLQAKQNAMQDAQADLTIAQAALEAATTDEEQLEALAALQAATQACTQVVRPQAALDASGKSTARNKSKKGWLAHIRTLPPGTYDVTNVMRAEGIERSARKRADGKKVSGANCRDAFHLLVAEGKATIVQEGDGATRTAYKFQIL